MQSVICIFHISKSRHFCIGRAARDSANAIAICHSCFWVTWGNAMDEPCIPAAGLSAVCTAGLQLCGSTAPPEVPGMGSTFLPRDFKTFVVLFNKLCSLSSLWESLSCVWAHLAGLSCSRGTGLDTVPPGLNHSAAKWRWHSCSRKPQNGCVFINAVIVGLTSHWPYPSSAGTPLLGGVGWVGALCNPYYNSANMWVSLLMNTKVQTVPSVPG